MQQRNFWRRSKINPKSWCWRKPAEPPTILRARRVDKGLLGVHRMTLTAMAVDLAQAPLARAGLSPLGGLSAEALVARVIHKLKAESIPYFKPVADTPGLARAVCATIAELRLEGVRPESVAATGAPGSDLARMAALYEEELANRSAADFALLLRYAIAAAREGKHRLLGLPVVLLDVDLDARLRRELAEAVMAQAPAVFDGRLGKAPLQPAGTLDRIRQSLFAQAVAPDGEPDASLDYFSAAGESLECVEIARRIRKFAAEGTPFDRMAILLRSPERYQPLVEEALRRATIPAYFSRGVARPDPAGRAFLALLACAAEGCSATRFAEYLSLGQAPPLDRTPRTGIAALPPDDEVLARLYERADIAVAEPAPEPDEPEDAAVIGGTLQSPAAWEKLLVDAAVIGGPDRWARRLRGLEAEYRVRLADLGQKEEGRRATPGAGNRAPQKPGKFRTAADRAPRRIAAARRLGRLDRSAWRAGRSRATAPRIRAVGACRIANHGRGGPGDAR